MRSHLFLNGTWVACDDEACDLIFHLPETTPTEAHALPVELLWPLLEMIQPPDRIEPDGTKLWLDNEGRAHRAYDLPATMQPDGRMEWRRHGQLHRAGDKPAAITAAGEQFWFLNGVNARSGGKPALIRPAGGTTWYINGAAGRTGGGPAVIRDNGQQEWRRRGMLHRRGLGPEVITASGVKRWYRKERSHRFPLLPAVVHPDGGREYWWRGVLLHARTSERVTQTGCYNTDFLAGDLP